MRPTPTIRLRNLTPHTIDIWLHGQRGPSLAAERPTPRCDVLRASAGTVRTQAGDIPVVTTRLAGGVTDLPNSEPGTMLIVSRAIIDALPQRDDLVFPDDLVRDPTTGSVIGCRALGRLAAPFSYLPNSVV